jgi:hypothetical protein
MTTDNPTTPAGPSDADDRALYEGQRWAREDEICTCGRHAVLVLGNRWGGCGWCGTSDLGPIDSRAAEQRRVALQTALGRPLRHSDLTTMGPPTTGNDHDLPNLLPTP